MSNYTFFDIIGLLLIFIVAQSIFIIGKETYSTLSEDPDLNRNDFLEKRHTITCFSCESAINIALNFVRLSPNNSFIRPKQLEQDGKSHNPFLAAMVITICQMFQPREICEGLIHRNIDILLYIARNKPKVTSRRFCSILLQHLGCDDPQGHDWKVKVPQNDGVLDNLVQSVTTMFKTKRHLPGPPLKILHLTDIHYDMNYTVGSNAVCNEPLCCRPGTKPTSKANAAGKWGDYRSCDTPWHVVENSFDHIISTHKNLSFVYFTGDIVDHKVWDTSIERNTEAITRVIMKMKETFGDIPVYPVLGNHEPHPVDLLSPPEMSKSRFTTQWIFNLCAKLWKQWLPEETQSTILSGAYYTVLVKPGLRVVALNSNVCYHLNFWLIYDDNDPFGQLKWLVKVLSEAEKNNEVVHILSHVPTGDYSCLRNWGYEFSKIVARFSNIIKAQFNGHTHKIDHTIYFKSRDFSQPGHIAFNGGSLTPWYNKNPNYIVHEVDSENFEVLDYDAWTFDLAKANLHPDQPPKWYKLYSFKETYGVDSLKPEDMVKLVIRIATNDTLLWQMMRYKVRDAIPSLSEGCNKQCQILNMCNVVTSYYGDSSHCDIMKGLMKRSSRRFY